MWPLIPLKELSKFRSMIDGIRPRQWRPSGGKRCELGLVTWINIIGVRHMDIFEFWG